MRRRLPALTGLRFVAASMVFILHSMPDPQKWLSLDQGVSFFFTLSGFILAYIYPDLPDLAAVKRFCVARLARLWPLHLLTTLLVVGISGIPSFETLTLNALLLQAWVPIQRIYFSYNAVSWSISTEVFFCLMFPLLILSLKTNWHWKLFGSAVLVVALIAACNVSGLPLRSVNDVSAHGLLYINPLSRVFEFIAGMCCCLLWRTLQARMPGNTFWMFTLAEGSAIALAIVLLIYPFPFAHPALGPAGVLWIMRTSAIPGFCLIIVVFAFGRGLVSQLLGSKLLEFLGEISFAIYLIHVLVIGAYRSQFKAALAVSPSADFAITVALCLLAATAMHLLIERPCRSLIIGLWKLDPVGPYTPGAVTEATPP
ncbi:MAG TPA: acyltransferase [Bradyrhizobium sp.]|nr:acyltransferase [Bradyrhizobium sp.]